MNKMSKGINILFIKHIKPILYYIIYNILFESCHPVNQKILSYQKTLYNAC